MSFFNRWLENYEQAMRNKVLVQLKGLPERHLDIAGISPEMLDQGVKAWPWRATETQGKEIHPEVVKELFGDSKLAAQCVHAANTAREFDSAA